MRALSSILAGLSVLLTVVGPGLSAYAQPSSGTGTALNLTVRDVGLSIGDSKRTTGLRLNYRDRSLQRVTGINLTLWRPHDEAGGTINGIAVGLPLTGSHRIRGVGVGAGISAQSALDGLFVAPVGLGSGEHLRGIAVGGLGLGAGDRVQGVMIGGLGAGAGEQADGLLLGGLGAGAGGTVNGILMGGLGAGAGEHANGILIGGLGAGAGESATGLILGGLGAGAGDTLNGIGLSVGGVGAGDALKGLGIGGLGVGAGDSMTGLAVAGIGVGSSNVTGLSVSGAYTRVEGGALRGLSISAHNDIRGTQRGVVIGLYNYTRHLDGVQIGVLNFARNNPVWARILPVLNLNV